MTETTLLRRIGPMSVAKTMGLLYTLMGLIFGAILSLFSMAGAALGMAGNSSNSMFAVLFGVGAVILMPIFYGLMGFVMGLVSAAIYNFVAGMTGGIEIQFTTRTPPGQV